MEDKEASLKTFSTEPKTWKHISPWSISGNRLRDFMETLFRKGLKNCSYQTLLFEAENFFETNDPRTIDRYIGRPSGVKRYPGSNVVRLNRQSGKLAHFNYMNEKRMDSKKGLIEILGYASLENDRYILHHERMSYYSEQSKLDLCARHIGDVEVIEPSIEAVKDTREEEESYRQHTHKSVLPQGITEKHTVLQLNPLEKAILRASPIEEPDRSKVSWPKQPPVIPELEPEETDS